MAESTTLQIRGQSPAKSTGPRTFRSGRQVVEGPVIRSGVHGSDRLLAMRLYRLDVLRARSRDIIEREIRDLRRDLWEMSNDLKHSLVRLYQESLKDAQEENSSTDIKKSARSKSRPSIFTANQKRPNYSDIDDDDKRRRAEKNKQSYLNLIDRYQPRGFGTVPAGGAESTSPDMAVLHLQKRSHTTMLPARTGLATGDSPNELFDLFVRLNTDTNLTVRSADAVSMAAKSKHVHLPDGLGNNSSSTSSKHVQEISKSPDKSERASESLSINQNPIDVSKPMPTQYINCKQVSEQMNLQENSSVKKKSTLKKKTSKKDDSSKDFFDLDFLDKEMRRKLLQQFDRNKSPDNNGNNGGKTKNKVAVTMPKIIRDSQLSRRTSVIAKPAKRGNGDLSSMVSANSGGDGEANSHQLPAIKNSDS